MSVKNLTQIKRLISNNPFKIGYGETEQSSIITIKIGIYDHEYEIKNKTASALTGQSREYDENRFWRVLQNQN